MRLAVPLLLVLAAALPACKKSKGADCGAAGKAFVELTQRQLEHEADPASKQQALTVLPALREKLTEKCKDDQWDERVRACIVAAKNVDDLERCEPGDAPTAASPAASGDPTAAPRAADPTGP